MKLKNIKINDGFLGGIDVPLSDGLNVIIGPRGSGKSTLIELMAFALTGSADDSLIQKVEKQLKSGQIIIDLVTNSGEHRTITSSLDRAEKTFEFNENIISFSQNKIESVADTPENRMALIDLRAGSGSQEVTDDILNKIEKITSQRFDLVNKKEMLLISGPDIQLIEQELSEQRAKKIKFDSSNKDLEYDREKLEVLETSLVDLKKIRENVTLKISDIKDLQISSEYLTHKIGKFIDYFGEPEEIRQHQKNISNFLDYLKTLEKNSSDSIAQFNDKEEKIRQQIAPIRYKLDSQEQGYGAIVSKIKYLEMELEFYNKREKEVSEIENQIQLLEEQRGSLFSDLESSESQKYGERYRIASEITQNISDNIEIIIDKSADTRKFKEFLEIGLRGSRIRQQIIEKVSSSILPRNLLELIEEQDAETISLICEISIDNANKIIARLNEPESLNQLSRILIEDTATFYLKDLATKKKVEELSTGQKCAVTLPIITSEKNRVILLDQPEDHLDNEFLVGNVIQSLKQRRESNAQTIIVTHNPNIPVIGEADNVISLTSNGVKGFLKNIGNFTDTSIVEDIKTVMEGGEEAFARRAKFYETNSSN